MRNHAIAALFCVLNSATCQAGNIPDRPAIILWAWEMPEDLRFLNTSGTGVAFLASSFLLRGDQVRSRPRLQPVLLNPGVSLLSVVRIECDRRQAPVLSSAQRARLATLILKTVAATRTPGLQIDFDARVSERPFYRALLFDLRRKLGTGRFLSITALPSWCNRGSWLAELPVDEIVPMLFRIGGERRAVITRLERYGSFEEPRCQASIGVSTDEPHPPLPNRAHTYIFHPKPWTKADVESAIGKGIR